MSLRFSKLYENKTKVIPDSKYCRGCRTYKMLDDYYLESDSKDGHMSRCKACIIRQKYGPFTARAKIEFILGHFPDVYKINPGSDIIYINRISAKLRESKFYVLEKDLSFSSVQNLVIKMQREHAKGR